MDRRSADAQGDPAGAQIVMVGLMGAGKSAIGRRLAARLGLPFVDADAEIEAAAGRTISEIFRAHGEEAFRQGERAVITRLLDSGPKVLATGGGAFMDDEIRALIEEKAVSVWLKADLDVLVTRTSRRKHRPILREGDPREILGRLIDERYPVYAHADLTVQSTDGPPEETVDRVLAGLKRIGAEKAGKDGVGNVR
ncbi:MAG: shikimate kinase [Alphaproteobacteria bacterium]|nr:shikimate kinase [Alphaproteobacteria bacterium]